MPSRKDLPLKDVPMRCQSALPLPFSRHRHAAFGVRHQAAHPAFLLLPPQRLSLPPRNPFYQNVLPYCFSKGPRKKTAQLWLRRFFGFLNYGFFTLVPCRKESSQASSPPDTRFKKRMNMVAACARVAVPRGSKADSVTPVTMPASQAHRMAGSAYPDTSPASP